MNNQILASIREAFPDEGDISISEPLRIREGGETEIYSFDVDYELEGQRRREPLILRIFPGQGAAEQATKEFEVMRQLHEADYPVPAVLQIGGEGSPIGKPFILMERIAVLEAEVCFVR